jgi:hypothetical protein
MSKGRQLGEIISSTLYLRQIAPCLKQGLANHRSGAHAGARQLVLTIVDPLRVLTESAFHRQRVADDHVVDPVAIRLDRCESAADYAGAAGTSAGSCNSAIAGFFEGEVPGVQTVDTAQVCSVWTGGLIAVTALKTDGGFLGAQVAMGIDHAWYHHPTLSINHLCPLRRIQSLADFSDLAILDQDAAVGPAMV